MSDEELIVWLRSLKDLGWSSEAADRIEEYARAFTNLQREYGARGERIAELTDPVAVHANMLRGTIAKPTVEQIIHLYGVDALCKALAPVIVREAGYDPAADLAERVARLEGAQKLREEIAALEKLCDHDCDNEDCVRCFHYPEILEQKRKQLATITDGGKDG